MARLPVDVKLARMLVAAQAQGCLRPMLVIAPFLGIQDPRERPPEARAAADNAHALVADWPLYASDAADEGQRRDTLVKLS
ncbi:hypothetical protein OEZ84_27355, partial [Leclercia adecarboxylata]|uniref:hypothetical protein n=1 Tax=Leclercia adecarboxylata TaxID=83655 RepID=UPI00234CD298|nr:hypothetical protein [Leclercia adecarboxylata]